MAIEGVEPSRRARRAVLIAVALACLVVGGVLATVARSSDDGEDVYLEGALDTGLDPFTTIASTSDDIPSGSTTTALYGGTGDQQVCDPEALIEFLRTHPEKAAAWVQALNDDASLRWSKGDSVSVDQIPEYIRELTPTHLAEDTRVTNHGYKDGTATPRQSILQKGTAVLVDRDGIPRARCACGNPLGRPHKVRDPHYKGECWEGCHDRPPCAPPGCVETTTTSSPSTSTTGCTAGVVAVAGQCDPPPSSTSTTSRQPKPRPTTTTTKFVATTTTQQVTTTAPRPPVTTTAPPQQQQTTTSVAGKP